MIGKTIGVSLLAPLLVPLAVASGVLLLVLVGATFWTSGVHVLLTRFGRRAVPERFPAEERRRRTPRF